MAESQRDELADALAKMARGESQPSDNPAPSPTLPPVNPVRPAPVKPVSARPNAPVVIVPRSAATVPATPPVTPRPTRPAAPVSGGPASPTRTPRPVAPAMTSAPGTVRKDRPMAPTLRPVIAPTDAEADSGQSTGLSAESPGAEIVDDDDSVIMPALEASSYKPKSKTTADVRAQISRKRNLEYRRTLIPVLLMTGTLMIVFGILRFFTGPDSMLANLPVWLPIVLLSGGLILLALAGVNMLSVKHQLDAK